MGKKIIKDSSMNITIIGSGYVGLVSGACLADIGHTVTCVDTCEQRIELLNKNIIPIHEPGLSELIRKNSSDNKILFSKNLKESLKVQFSKA